MELTNQTIAAIDHLCSKFGIAIDWSAENVLPYLQDLYDRYIRYQMSRLFLEMFFIIALMIGMGFWLRFCFKKQRGTDICSGWHEVWFASIVVCGCCFAIGTFLMIVSVGSIIKCNMVPEMVFISAIASLGA